VTYVYGLLEPGHPANPGTLAGQEGVTGPIRLTDLPTARLVHGPAVTGEILPRRRLLLAHARILEVLARVGSVLPMRFGMQADPAALGAVLAAQAEEVEKQFDAVRGCAEYGIRVSFPREAALSVIVSNDPDLASERARLAERGGTGRMEAADFGRRLAERLDRKRAAAQRELLTALAPDLAAHVLRAPEDDVQTLAIDALVSASRAEGLAARIETLARSSAFAPGAEPFVRLVGPGPAYSFVRLTLDTAPRAA
jgi:hypothetical protein